MNSKELIKKLGLTPHPEGGYFKEVYRSSEIIRADALPERYSTERAVSTSIYFLLESGDFSAFHRLQSDETWHFHTGSPVFIYMITDNGKLIKVELGNSGSESPVFQYTIFKNVWFAAEVKEPGSFTLVGCTVAPGFDFTDFEFADRFTLLEEYPLHKDIIEKLTNE